MTQPQRFPLLALDEMTPDQRAVHDAIASGPRGGLRGPFIALLHNPPLAQHVQGLGEHLRFKTGIPDALVELVILVTARHWNCAYEWYAHEKLARKVGLPQDIIAAINDNRLAPAMSAEQALVHGFCTGTLRQGAPSDASFDAVAAAFGRAGALDMLALCGYYTLLAFTLNTAQLPIPEGDGLPLAVLS
jgi:4-carboxymuconolactone decarboxylase